jgi:O-antigen/teichoic acid export membrane protein
MTKTRSPKNTNGRDLRILGLGLHSGFGFLVSGFTYRYVLKCFGTRGEPSGFEERALILSQSDLIVDSEPPKAAALGQHTSRGIAWMVGQTLFSKFISTGGQIVMAWLLLPKEFGVVTLAYAVAAFGALIRDAGLQNILVQRQTHFRRWAGPVFWMSLILGLVATVLMAITAPIASRALNAPGLTGLVLVLAASTPFNALATVPAAKLQIDLRFRFQAILGFVIATATTALNILFAWMKFGPYAFILPYALTVVARTVILWMAAPVAVGWNLRVHRWKHLFRDSGIILATLVFGTLISQGDYLTLGFVKNPQVVGIFYFAFNLSMQTYVLLTVSVGGTFFPALAKLKNEPLRQMEGFLKAARTFALICFPLCFLQAALSDPGIRLVFKPEWYPAIPILQVLSVTMGIRSALILAQSLAASQGAWGTQFLANVISSVAFMVIVGVCAVLGGSQAGSVVAFGEMCFFALSDGTFFYVMLRRNGRSLKDLLHVVAVPAICSMLAVGLALLVDVPFGRFLPGGHATLLLRIGAISVIALGGYALALMLFAESTWMDLTSRFRVMLKR